MYYCFKTINHTLHTQYNTNYIKTTTTSSTTITLNNMALNMHDDNINPLRPTSPMSKHRKKYINHAVS